MSFRQTPTRRLCYVRAAGLAVLGLVFLGFPLLADVDALGKGLMCFFVGLCAAGIAYNLWRARRMSTKAVTMHVAFAPTFVQVRYLRRGLWIVAVASAVATVLEAVGLCRVEFGGAKDVVAWEAAAAIYARFGFWPAVLFMPSLGIIICLALLLRIRTLQSKADHGRGGDIDVEG